MIDPAHVSPEALISFSPSLTVSMHMDQVSMCHVCSVGLPVMPAHNPYHISG